MKRLAVVLALASIAWTCGESVEITAPEAAVTVGVPAPPTATVEPTPTDRAATSEGVDASTAEGSGGIASTETGPTAGLAASGVGSGATPDDAPASIMSLFIEADVTWSDPTGCTVTTTTMHARIQLQFHDNGLIDGTSDESSMGHTPVTRCGENHMGDWTTIEPPVVTVLPSYWDEDGLHLRLDWWDITEIAISTGPVQQAATIAVARDSLCQDWPGNLYLFLIPADWDRGQPARCEFASSSGNGEIFLAITHVDDAEVWRSIPEFLDHLTFPTEAEYEAILEARARAEAELDTG